MKIERFCIQKNAQNALYPVRALRVTDYPNEPERDFLSLLKPVFDTPEQLLARIESFKREFPKGRVEVEISSDETRLFRKSDVKWLFDHPMTYVSSL